MKYIKKPVIVEAFQLGIDDAPDWFIDGVLNNTITISTNKKEITCVIETLEGAMYAESGSFIIRGTHGEIYPCKENIFYEIYDKYE